MTASKNVLESLDPDSILLLFMVVFVGPNGPRVAFLLLVPSSQSHFYRLLGTCSEWRIMSPK